MTDLGTAQIVRFSGLEANTEYSITTIYGIIQETWHLDFISGSFVSGSYGAVNKETEWKEFTDLKGDAALGNTIWGISFVARTDEDGTLAFTPTSGNTEISLLSISTIPEPSAFGFIAGALALVASRRRRR